MRPLRLRFSAPWHRRLGASPIAIVLLLAALAWFGHDLWLTLRVREELAAQRAAAAAQVAPPARATARASSAPPVPAVQVAAANQAILRLNLPWREVFDALEEAAGQQVSVVSLEPDADKRLLQVGAEVASPAQMLDFVSRLKRQGEFEQVTLRRHELASSGPADARPLKFVVALIWRDARETSR